MKKKETKKEELEETIEETTEIIEEEQEASENNIEKELSQLKDKNLRLLAEFDNYKRRTQKEKESTYQFATSTVVGNMLPILDTLELSLKQEATDVTSFKTGIELVCKQFIDTLSKIGVTVIETKDQPFDPELHNAVMRDEESDKESGTIVEEFQKGYKINDKVIRHSMVKVKA